MSSTGRTDAPPHPMVAAVDEVLACLDTAADVSVWSLSDEDTAAVVGKLARAKAKLCAVELEAVREAEGRDLARRTGATGTAAWLKGEVARMSSRAASGTVKLAHALDQDLTVTRDALRVGRINLEHAHVIHKAVRRLPKDLDPQIRAEAEETLVELASDFNPDDLAKAGATILEVVAPEVAEEQLARKLAEEERRAERGRELSISPDPYTPGRSRVWAALDAETTEMLRAALDPLAKPRPTDDGGPDHRTPAQRNGDAFHEMLRRFLARGDDLPTHGGNKPQVVVTVTDTNLKNGTGYGRLLASQTPVSIQKVRELACDAQVSYIWRQTRPGDLAGADRARLFEGKLRRLLELRDRGCAFPHCDRPPSWCAAHHIRHWVDGGSTSLQNGVLLCSYHHRLIHREHWTIHLDEDHIPEFTPPEWIDKSRRPLRNTRLRL